MQFELMKPVKHPYTVRLTVLQSQEDDVLILDYKMHHHSYHSAQSNLCITYEISKTVSLVFSPVILNNGTLR